VEITLRKNKPKVKIEKIKPSLSVWGFDELEVKLQDTKFSASS
jgi:hypothetical protein